MTRALLLALLVSVPAPATIYLAKKAAPPAGITRVSSAVVNTTADNPSITVPGSVQNDDLFVVCAFQAQDPASHTITTDTFTQVLFDSQNVADDVSVSCQWRVRDGTEGATFTLDDSRSGTHHWAIFAVAFRGVDTTTPMDVADAHDEYTNQDPFASGNKAPSVTTVTDDAMLLHFFSFRDAAGSPGLCSTLGGASGETEDANSPLLSDQNRQAAFSYVIQETAGASTAVSPTGSGCPTDAEGYAVTLALRPA